MADVSDAIRDLDDLPFGGVWPTSDLAFDMRLRFGVIKDSVPCLDSEVEATPVFFECVDDPQTLLIVTKAGKHARQCRLARVPKWRVPEIVGEADRLCEIFVEMKGSSDRPCNLSHL